MSRRAVTKEPARTTARDCGLGMAASLQRRPTWALLGAALVVVAMVAGAWVFTSSARTTPVLVAAHDIAAGEVASAGDFQAVEVSDAVGLRAVTPTEMALIGGRAARGPIPKGSLVNVDMFVGRDAVVPAGMVVVGAALDPGASPSAELAAGDRVEVLAVGHTASGGSDGQGPAVLTVGSVWAVEAAAASGSGAGRSWVSLLVPQSVHAAVAQAAADGRLRLGLLGAAE